jgi:hypothetical protein
MKAIRKFSPVGAGWWIITALALSTALAGAQSSLHGTFDLPMAVHWGKSILPAGEYSFTVEILATAPVVTVHSADSKWAAMFLPQALSQAPETPNPELLLTNRGGAMFVSSFRLGELGMALNYAVPKPTEAARARERPASLAVFAASTP